MSILYPESVKTLYSTLHLLNRFRKRGINIFVATDVAGRAGNAGVAITFVIQAKWGRIVSEVEEITSNPKKRFKGRVPVY